MPPRPEVLQVLSEVKAGLRQRTVPILDPMGRTVGRAEALGAPHITDGLVERFVRWRNANRSGWLDQRPVTVTSTREWLARYLASEDTLLYLLFAGEALVGRTGLVSLTCTSFVTDGLVRGERGGGPNFIRRANRALMRADLEFTGVDSIISKILSTNEMALESSDRLGYRTAREVALYCRRTPEGLVLVEEPTAERDSRSLLYRVAHRGDILQALSRDQQEEI